MKPLKMSNKQTEKMGEEIRKLLADAHTQCEEHKAWLRGVLLTWDRPQEMPMALILAVDEIAVELVQMEPGLKEDDKPTVTLVYSYPDVLHDWLARPENLNLSLDGGTTLDGETPSLKA